MGLVGGGSSMRVAAAIHVERGLQKGPENETCENRFGATALQASAGRITFPVVICSSTVAGAVPTAVSSDFPNEPSVSVAVMSPLGATCPVFESMFCAP